MLPLLPSPTPCFLFLFSFFPFLVSSLLQHSLQLTLLLRTGLSSNVELIPRLPLPRSFSPRQSVSVSPLLQLSGLFLSLRLSLLAAFIIYSYHAARRSLTEWYTSTITNKPKYLHSAGLICIDEYRAADERLLRREMRIGLSKRVAFFFFFFIRVAFWYLYLTSFWWADFSCVGNFPYFARWNI